MKSLRIYCVSHEEPLLPRQLYDYVVGLGQYQPAHGSHISQLDPFWHSMRSVAYGAAGNYGIPRAVDRELPRTELTGIFSHRKCVVRTAIGRVARRYPAYREVSMVEAAELPREECCPAGNNEFLIGPLLSFPQGLVRQYAEVHRVVDLFDYLTLAVKMNVLTSDQLNAFVCETVFIPGGCELGIYPTAWILSTLQSLASLGEEFLNRHGDRIRTYDSYQVRCVGFLAERLGSFVLLETLRQRYPLGIPQSLIGCVCNVVEGNDEYQGARVEVFSDPRSIPRPITPCPIERVREEP